MQDNSGKESELFVALYYKDRAVCGVVLRLLACWFESRGWHGNLSLVNIVCCQVEVSSAGRSLIQRNPT